MNDIIEEWEGYYSTNAESIQAELEAEIAALRAQLAEARERERSTGYRLYRMENETFRIGRYLRDYELDEDGEDQNRIGKELIFLSTLCDNCKGAGEDGDPPDANGEGGGTYACESCKGTGRNAAALAAAQEGSDAKNSQ